MKNNSSYPAVFLFVKRRKRLFYNTKTLRQRSINLPHYGAEDVFVERFYKSISRMVNL